MAVEFVNGASNNAGGDTVAITPGAGANYQLLFGYVGGTTPFTVTFGGDSMGAALLAVADEPNGLWDIYTALHGLAGDYTGASRDVTASLVGAMGVACFSGVDQASPILHARPIAKISSGTQVSTVISGANNPVGSRIFWAAAHFNARDSAPTANIGTVHGSLGDAVFSNFIGGYGSVAGTGEERTLTITVSGSAQDILLFAVVLAEESGGGPLPGEPTIDVRGTAEDAIRIELAALPDDADAVAVHYSQTTGVDDTDPEATLFSAPGVYYLRGLDPSTAYYLRAIAENSEGTTPGDEESATTFGDDWEGTGEDQAEIVIPFEVPDGETGTSITLRIGELIRDAVGEGRTRSMRVVVMEGETELADETYTGEDIANVDGGVEQVVPLVPTAEGPTSITATITVSIDPPE